MSKLELSKEAKGVIISPLPGALIKERDGGGGKKLSYISGSTVSDILNKAFGYMWNWEIVNMWVQESQPYFNQYSKVPEQEKTSYNGKRGAWEKQASVAHVHGRLTVRFITDEGKEQVIIKDGCGSKSIIGKQNEQESIFKAAGTDALKKAASLLGIGLELYRDEDEQQYFNEINYEDPWTEEMLTKFSKERDYLKNFMEQYKLDEDDMAQYVAEYSEGSLNSIYDIVPENIEAFAEFLKAKVTASEEQQKTKLQKKK
jgi:hypothetical protein